MRKIIPAGIGGLNTRDQFDTMSPLDCTAILNLYPRGTFLESRESITIQKSLSNSESVIEYPAVQEQILYSASGSIYKLGEDLPIFTGLANSKILSSFYKEITFCVNGTANIHQYDGTDFTDETANFTGITAGDIITNVFISKDRVWFIYLGTDGGSGVYYTELGTITGALDKFPLNFKSGGACVMGGNFSQDSGLGLDDLTYFISSNGDTLIYQGIDFGVSPSDPFRVIQSFSMSKPIGNRVAVNVNADVLVMTQNGLESMARNLSADRANVAPISDKINRLINDLSDSFSTYGWDLKYFRRMGALWITTPEKKCYILNIKDPTPQGEFSWTVFDINANSLGVYNDDLYFTNVNGFFKYAGYLGDKIGTNYETVLCSLEQAPNNLGYQDEKQFLGIKPYFESRASVDYQIAIIVDFQSQAKYYDPNYTPLSGSAWDTASWNTFTWYAGDKISQQVRDIISDTGVRISLGITFQTKQKVKILSNELLYEKGSAWK